MKEERIRGRSRRRKTASLARAGLAGIKRFLSLVVCTSLVSTGIANSAMLAYGITPSGTVQEFSLKSEDLKKAMVKAASEGEPVGEEELQFEGAEAQQYEELLLADDMLYELDTEAESDGNRLKLRTFARLDETQSLDAYEITGNEEIIFLLVNDSKEERTGRIVVDGVESDDITVVPADSVEQVIEIDLQNPTAGAGAAGTGAGAGGVNAGAPEENQAPEESEAPGESQAPEEGEAPEESQAPEESEAPGESQAPEESEAPGESQAPEESEAPGESQAPEEGKEPEAGEGKEESGATGENGAPEESGSAEEAGESGNEGSGIEAGAEEGESSSEAGASDTGSEGAEAADAADAGTALSLNASISIHTRTLLTTAETASPSNAENETEDDEEETAAHVGELDGEIYEAVLVNGKSAAAYAITAGELGLEDNFAESSYTCATEKADITAVVPGGAFSESVTLTAQDIEEGSEKYEELKNQIAAKGYSTYGLLLYDISFVDADGQEVEPLEGAEIQVNIELKQPEKTENAGLENKILHIHEDEVTELPDAEVETTEDNAVSGIRLSVDRFSVFARTASDPEKTVTVDPAGGAGGEIPLYPTVQDAINYIEKQEDKAGWTIIVKEGTYSRFTVLNGMNDLTVKAAEGEKVVIEVVNSSAAPAETSGAYPDTFGISVREANNVTLEGLTLEFGTVSNPWYAAGISNFTESGEKGDNITVKNCAFQGEGANIGVFINTGTTQFNVMNCSFDGFKEAVSMYGDGTLMKGAEVTGNTFTNCSFALHGYYGGSGEAGSLNFADNTVTGTESLRCKIVIQDQTNTGALKADVKNNTLTNAIVGLVNLRESGETVSPVLDSNTFGDGSFYVEAVEPGTIDFYTSYQVPENSQGYWKLTGVDDLDVDWGKNPDGSTAYATEKIIEANRTGSHTLNFTGIDENNLIKTFTWFKDAIYWVTPDENPNPDIPATEWTTSKSKEATQLALTEGKYRSNVTLSLPAAEEKLVSDVVFVLDKSTSPSLEDQALQMLSDLKEQVDATGAEVKVGVVIFNKAAHVSSWMNLSTQYGEIEAAIKQDISSGTNTHAGLLAGTRMLDEDTEVEASRKYLVFVSDGITYMYGEEPTVTAWTFWADAVKDWAGPDNWYSKYKTEEAPADWEDWMSKIGAGIAADGDTYDYPVGGTAVNKTPLEEASIHPMSVDKALYYTNQVYKEASSKGYRCYAMRANPGLGQQYLWGPAFMDYLAGGKDVSFDMIKNDILYLLDAGSWVTDYMGYVENDYNFNFVNSSDALTLTVNKEPLAVTPLGDGLSYGFGNENGSSDGKTYPYVLRYVPGDLKGGEHFVWEINTPVSQFEPVTLTYVVELQETKAAGAQTQTYGAYDRFGENNDGSLSYGLYTNNSATLHPVDSNKNQLEPEDFLKPAVSYTVNGTGGTTPTDPGSGGGGGHSGGGGGGGSSSGGPKASTAVTGGPGVQETKIEVEEVPEEMIPSAGLPKTGEHPADNPMIIILMGMLAVMYVGMSEKKKEEA